MDNRKQLWELIYRTTRVMVEAQAAARRTHVIRNRTTDDSLVLSLNEKRLSPYLIMEEFSDEDANKLEQAVTELTGIVEDMGKKLADAGMDGTASALTDLAGSIPDTSGIAALAIKGDTKALQAQTGEVNEALSQVQEAVALIVASLTDLGTNLGNFEAKLDDAQKEKTIQELAEDEELVKAGNFVDSKSLEKGVGKAFKVPGWFKSAVNKGMSAAKGAKDSGVMGFFKGLFGGGGGKKKLIDQKVFTQDVLKTPFNKFLEVSKAMSGAQGPLEAAIGGSAEAGATAQAAAGAPGDEGPAEVEDPKKPEKRPGFDLMAWIEEKYPDLFKRLQTAKVDDDDEDVVEIDSEVEDGTISPEDAITDMEAEAGKMKAADVLAALEKALEPDDEALETYGIPDDFDGAGLAGAVVNKLKKDELVEESWSWKNDASLEYLLEARRVSLLLEQDESVTTAEWILKASEAGTENESEAAWAAWRMFIALKDAGMEIEGEVPKPESGEGEGADDEGATGEPSEEDIDDSVDAVLASAEEAAGADADPVAGVSQIVADWATSTPTLEKNISGKQTDALTKAAADVVGKAQEMVIQGMMDAVDAWRGTQKVLQKPHTSDKQIDALKKGLDGFLKKAITVDEAAVRSNASARMERRLRDKMTSFLLEATDLRNHHLNRLGTWELIETFTIAYCDAWIDNEPIVMTESSENHGFSYTYDHVDSYDENELIKQKWMRMAGLPGF